MPTSRYNLPGGPGQGRTGDLGGFNTALFLGRTNAPGHACPLPSELPAHLRPGAGVAGAGGLEPPPSGLESDVLPAEPCPRTTKIRARPCPFGSRRRGEEQRWLTPLVAPAKLPGTTPDTEIQPAGTHSAATVEIAGLGWDWGSWWVPLAWRPGAVPMLGNHPDLPGSLARPGEMMAADRSEHIGQMAQCVWASWRRRRAAPECRRKPRDLGGCASSAHVCCVQEKPWRLSR